MTQEEELYGKHCDQHGYNEEQEVYFKVRRNFLHDITNIECSFNELKECLKYIDKSSMGSHSWIYLKIDNCVVVIRRLSMSSCVFVQEHEILYDGFHYKFPYKVSDKRIMKQIKTVYKAKKKIK